MKNYKLYLLLVIILFGCTLTEVKVIDGCQYIKTTSQTGNGPVVSLTHKGDCNNPIHKENRK